MKIDPGKSITCGFCNDRCQLACTYWQDWQKLPAGEILSYEELLRLAGIAARLGIRKVRVTGGEPPGEWWVSSTGSPGAGIEEVCLTTNGAPG
jgi:cyclic pyranopterin phosphate synthase